MDTLLNVGLLVVVLILLYPRSLGGTIKKALPVAAVFAGMMVIAAYCLYSGNEWNYLEIRALDQKNSSAEGTEVWLQSVRIDGVDYAPEDIFSEGWFSEKGYLKWRSYDQPFELSRSITANIPAEAMVDLIFDTCKWRGLVEVKRSKAFSFSIDCYTDSDYEVGRNVSYLESRSLDGLRIPGKGMFLMIFAVLAVLAGVFTLCGKGALPTEKVQYPPREVWLDILKVFSAFLIVIIHTVGGRFNTNPAENEVWGGYLFLNTVTLCAVPLFLMISGILLLGKQPKPEKVICNVKKALLLLIVWNIAYILLNHILWGGQKDIAEMILDLPFSRGPSEHLWYSYFMVWMYLFHPALCVFYRALSRWQRAYFVAITLIIPGVLDFYQKFFARNGSDILCSAQLCMTPAYMGMMVLGRLIYEEIKTHRSAVPVSLLAMAVGFGGAMLATQSASISQSVGTDRFLMETQLFPVCYAAGVLALAAACQSLPEGLSDTAKRFWERLSRMSLGIYFFHCAVIWTLGDFRFAGFLITRDGGFWEALFCAAVYYVLSVVCVAMMTRIPGLRRLVK